MAHVIDESISVINVTRVEMAENRQTINKLIVSLNVSNYKLRNITQALEGGISSWAICSIISTTGCYYSDSKKNYWARKCLHITPATSIKYVIMGSSFPISHYT